MTGEERGSRLIFCVSFFFLDRLGKDLSSGDDDVRCTVGNRDRALGGKRR